MGETGIGKTTLFRMILSFIEPTSGKIEVDGELCFVPQGNTLMSGTIRYNLQLARPDATDDELREVLHTACADFVFDLPDGLDTELGERGLSMPASSTPTRNRRCSSSPTAPQSATFAMTIYACPSLHILPFKP